MPKSKKLWLMATHKEQDPKIKSKILKRALEHLPAEVDLWKECIELQEPEEAKSLL
jgi:pre-mRNA-processing factor 6